MHREVALGARNGHGLQGPMDFADALCKYTAEESVKPVCDYVMKLGKCGKGLTDALPSAGVVGSIFGERAHVPVCGVQACSLVQ
jgi:hypothetical protein